MIKNDALREYADLLERNGFTIYEPKTPYGSWFIYSRMVDGQECFGYVQRNYATGTDYSHSMPIKPSVENGSSMFVESRQSPPRRGHQSRMELVEGLTVEAAKLVARPTNWNYLVGNQQNYRNDLHLYNKRGA